MNTSTGRSTRISIPAGHAVARIETLDWAERVSHELDGQGSALLERVLSAKECQALAGLYQEDGLFRSRVVMARHGFGRGEYKYFSYPLPEIIEQLRTSMYARLVPIANRWNAAMGGKVRYPEKHADFIADVSRWAQFAAQFVDALFQHRFEILCSRYRWPIAAQLFDNPCFEGSGLLLD